MPMGFRVEVELSCGIEYLSMQGLLTNITKPSHIVRTTGTAIHVSVSGDAGPQAMSPDRFTLCSMRDSTLYDRNQLLKLLHENALERGEFVLASGQKASFYLDCRRLTLDGQAANLIAEGILEKLDGDLPDAVGGMAIGADPITAAVITRAWQAGHSLRGFIVRKEAKEHGMGRQVEGPVQPGDRVVILEDVITTGGSSLRAIEHARAFGLRVDRLITIVDRGSDSAAVFDNVDVKFDALFRMSDLDV